MASQTDGADLSSGTASLSPGTAGRHQPARRAHPLSRTARLGLSLGTAGLALAAALRAAPAHAYCPCYTLSSAYNDHGCGVDAVSGDNPSPAQWNEIFALVSQGPAAWGDQGPGVSDIGQGCGKPMPLTIVPARFPCELLKGIAMQETGWRQFCEPDVPDDQIGPPSRTIISFDCGYGIGQVTSGMHIGEDPDFDRQRVAAEPTYNLATGTRILAEKWIATNCVGDNQPATIEHWYTATWAYNGLVYVNNPTNPNYDAFRGVWDPNGGAAAPYQEKVFGWIEHPPDGWYDAVALAYPNLGEVGGGGAPGELGEPSCASPTDCGNGRPTHPTACNGDEPGTTGDPATTTGEPATTSTTNDPSDPSSASDPGSASDPSSASTGPATTDADANTGAPTTGGDPPTSGATSAATGPITSFTTEPGGDDTGDDGCGCRSGAPSHAAWLALALLGLRRRSREPRAPSPASSTDDPRAAPRRHARG